MVPVTDLLSDLEARGLIASSTDLGALRALPLEPWVVEAPTGPAR